MGRIRLGWQLTKVAMETVRHDASLMWFPVVATMANFVILILTGSIALGIDHDFGIFNSDEEVSWVQIAIEHPIWALAFVFLVYAITWIATFCSVALGSCALRSFRGEDTTVRQGIELAWARRRQISLWAIVGTIVNLIVRALRSDDSIVARIIGLVLELGWLVATFFAIPVIVAEGLGPIESLKRSAQLMRERWGQSGTGVLVINIISFLALVGLMFVGLPLAVVAGFAAGIVVGVLVGFFVLLAAIALSLFFSTVRQVLAMALYCYASQEQVVGGFTAEQLQAAVSVRQRRGLGWGKSKS